MLMEMAQVMDPESLKQRVQEEWKQKRIAQEAADAWEASTEAQEEEEELEAAGPQLATV
jgi:hypothetical protein